MYINIYVYIHIYIYIYAMQCKAPYDARFIRRAAPKLYILTKKASAGNIGG